jgi:hypothetical protein
MALSEEGRERLQQAARMRNLTCGKCGGTSCEVVDGARIGGLAGLQYRHCPGCDWSTTIKPRAPRKVRL